MRVIDEDRRAAARSDQFEPALGANQMFQRREHASRIVAACNSNARGDERVLNLELADQRYPHVVVIAAMFDPHHLREAVDLGVEQADTGSGAAHADDGNSARPRGRHHGVSVRVINVDDGRAAWFDERLEQPQLGGEVGRKVWMIVEMIAGDVGESRDRDAQAVEPVLIEAVRGSFDGKMRDAFAG